MRALLFYLVALAELHAQLTISGNGTGSGVVRSLTTADYQATLSSTTNTRTGSPASTSTATVNGQIFTTYTGGTTYTDRQLTMATGGTMASGVQSFTFTSSVPSVATVNYNGLVTHLTAGTTQITATHVNPTYVVATTLTFPAPSASPTTALTGWTAGLLPASFNSEVDAMIAANGSNLNLLSASNDTTQTYTRNTALWTGNASGMTPSSTLSVGSPLDLSGVSVYNSESDAYNTKFGIALIAPDACLFAQHHTPSSSWVYTFVDNANVNHFATVTAVAQGPADAAQYNGHAGLGGTAGSIYTDLGVGKVTWINPSTGATVATPTTLKFYKLLPANYAHFVAAAVTLGLFPVVGIDQERQVYIHDVSPSYPTSPTLPYWSHNVPTEATRAGYISSVPTGDLNIWSGDSGFPAFVVVHGEPVLLGCNFTGFQYSDPADFHSAINTALGTVGSAYTVTDVNLTGLGYSTQW
jgi:hypothetical protein